MDQCHGNTGISSLTDPSYFQPTPNQQSFMLSPPYTPFSQNLTSFTQEDDALLSSAGQLSDKDLVGGSGCGFAVDMPSSCVQGTIVGDLSLSVIDQIPPIDPHSVMPVVSDLSSRPLALPLPPSQTNYMFAPPSLNMGRVDPPMLPPTNQILSMSGHVTHYCSQSSTPSPPEVQYTSFAANGVVGVPSEINFAVRTDHGTSYNPTNSSHRVQQGVVSETRARYGGMAPSHASSINPGSHREVGPIRGHASSRPIVPQGSSEVQQRSQWLKNGTPESVH